PDTPPDTPPDPAPIDLLVHTRLTAKAGTTVPVPTGNKQPGTPSPKPPQVPASTWRGPWWGH
ncbi:MAG TPA: hypothetical protein VGP06_17075, partial [Janthinobacterium sp.]|nr:hypothetical protein [Janthinobacterium sp.]